MVAEARQALSTRWSFVRVAVLLLLQFVQRFLLISHLSRRTNSFLFWFTHLAAYETQILSHQATHTAKQSPLSSPSTSDYQRPFNGSLAHKGRGMWGRSYWAVTPATDSLDARGVPSQLTRFNINLNMALILQERLLLALHLVNNTNLSYTAH